MKTPRETTPAAAGRPDPTGAVRSGSRPAWRRLPLLALGGLGLLAGIWGGLLRTGWSFPAPSAGLAAAHGALMVCGFLSTLIGLERAVALGRGWAYAAPLLTGVGAVALVVGAPPLPATSAELLGSAVFVLASIMLVLRQAASFTVTMAVGAVALAIGNGLWWAGHPVFRVVWWWGAFLLLTIAAERLELSRLVRRPRWATPAFVGACAVLLLGVTAATRWPETGTRITGSGMLLIALWLSLHDVARRTVRQAGLPRYVAACLLAGYAWLLVCGALLVVSGPHAAGLDYDAALHAFFVGFVFSMIFGHAPIILPAVLRVSIHYRPAFFLLLVLLHASLGVRMAGDLWGAADVRRWGATLNAIAIVAFIASMAWSTRQPPPARAAAGPAPRNA